MDLSSSWLEAKRQRERDAFKGFAYVESFDELLSWTEDDVDPLQRSNTPLVKRPRCHAEAGVKVMLIHDYMGGYNDYEACQSTVVEEEQYSCQFLQYVEVFVYFSHRLVAVPPPTWINTCHRNGVKVLGTFIVEPGSAQVECILQQDELESFWVARRLTELARCYGFDGWLINIETPFPLLTWSSARLEGFLRQLRAEVGVEGRVVWYDAITALNLIWYQNTLNWANKQFALAAGSILTNYAWTPELAESGKDLAHQSGLGLENLYFGIGVWAQNSQHDSKHKRVTWPEDIGGGTGTGLGVEVLKGLGLNAGLFAPGWSYEHFNENHSAVETAIWRGKALPQRLKCECNPDRPHDIPPGHGITKYARAYPSGSSCFFHTNFERAFSRTLGGSLHTQVGLQSISPYETEGYTVEYFYGKGTMPPTIRLMTAVRDCPARCVVSANLGDATAHGHGHGKIQIVKLMLSTAKPLELTIRYRVLWDVGDLSLQLTSFGRTTWLNSKHRELPSQMGEVITLKWNLNGTENRASDDAPNSNTGYIDGILITYQRDGADCDIVGSQDLLEIHEITIQPRFLAKALCDIRDIRVESRGQGPTTHYRVVWDIISDSGENDGALPYSHITGPCAFFTIRLDGSWAGRAYAREFVLSAEQVKQWRVAGINEIKVTGIGFNDDIICDATTAIAQPGISHEGWILT